jgi:LmbE family N-acetylglucosaminyl deacetylase
MIPFSLTLPVDRPLHILCLGAHCDDIEIGCGGTLLELTRRWNHNIAVQWVVFSSTETREREARACANVLLSGIRDAAIDIKKYRDGFFPYEGGLIKEEFETLKSGRSPDLIFTHFRDDRHQDHRVISDLTWNTFRNHLILEYEVPKYDGDFGAPNVFVPLTKKHCEDKCRSIYTHFVSQREKHWFSPETLMGLMRLRGMESATEYAEAFYCRKMVL